MSRHKPQNKKFKKHKNTLKNRFLDNPQGEVEFFIINILPVLKIYFPSVFNDKTVIDTPSAGMYAYSLDKLPVIAKDNDFV